MSSIQDTGDNENMEWGGGIWILEKQKIAKVLYNWIIIHWFIPAIPRIHKFVLLHLILLHLTFLQYRQNNALIWLNLYHTATANCTSGCTGYTKSTARFKWHIKTRFCHECVIAQLLTMLATQCHKFI